MPMIDIEVPEKLKGMNIKLILETALKTINWGGVNEVVDFITKHPDVFGYDYIGYWAYGIKRYPDRGWLIMDAEGDVDADIAIEQYEKFDTLLEDVWFLGREKAAEAALLLPNLEDWDANELDTAIQKALFGQVVYG